MPINELKEVILLAEELEAIKLVYVDGLDQAAAAARLKVSQPTVSRILADACAKVADAVVGGKALRIEAP
jgi:predicted DNA-binding protein (UPF0251 family)